LQHIRKTKEIFTLLVWHKRGRQGKIEYATKEKIVILLKRFCVVFLMMAVCLPALAKPKKKLYDNSSTSLFNAALRTARERHVVTYVNEKMLMFTFETGQSFLSKGFVANASVEPASDARRGGLVSGSASRVGAGPCVGALICHLSSKLHTSLHTRGGGRQCPPGPRV